jgi:hypothetical protein
LLVGVDAGRGDDVGDAVGGHHDGPFVLVDEVVVEGAEQAAVGFPFLVGSYVGCLVWREAAVTVILEECPLRERSSSTLPGGCALCSG